MNRGSRSGVAGFSALELVVSMTGMLVIALAGWSVQRTNARELHGQALDLSAAHRLRRATAVMERDIRETGADPRGTALVTTGAQGISAAGANRLLIESDRDFSGAIDPAVRGPAAERVLYAYDPETRRVLRTAGGAVQALAEDVPPSGFRLEYFDAYGEILLPAAADPAELTGPQRDRVALIRVTLDVAVAAGARVAHGHRAVRVVLRNRSLERL